MRAALNKHAVKVADEVWLVAASLHREQPWRRGFLPRELLERAARECIAGTLRPGLATHISQHCVANRPPNPGRYRILYALPGGERRLFRPGDDYHPQREGGKTQPEESDLPARYRDLLQWYAREFREPHAHHESLRGALRPRPDQPILDWSAAKEEVARLIAAERTGR